MFEGGALCEPCNMPLMILFACGLGVESYKKNALAIEHICSIYSDACVRRICITLIFVCKLAKAAKTS